MGIKITHLFKDFLDGVKEVLTSGSHMCISSPKELELETYARDAGLTVREKHLVRVHRSLTRQFVVLRNG
jgi:tRNA G10  N-methylase Trm11